MTGEHLVLQHVFSVMQVFLMMQVFSANDAPFDVQTL